MTPNRGLKRLPVSLTQCGWQDRWVVLSLGGMSSPAPMVFRPYLALPVAMGLGAAVWSAALMWLLWVGDLPWRLPVGAGIFAVGFALGAGYYGRCAIVVDGSGVTYRGLWRSFRMRFREVTRVEVLDGLLPVYCVRGLQKRLHFTSFFRRHQALLDILLERTGAPLTDATGRPT